MKLKNFAVLAAAAAFAFFPAGVSAKDSGLKYIFTRGEVRCGTDLSTRTYAYKDEYGEWKGFDADMCRLFSLAIFGDSSHFKLVHVSDPEISQALADGKIDVMFGNTALSAASELKSHANAAEILYYDRQMFLAEAKPGAKSMEAYRGSKVCTVGNSEAANNIRNFNRKYELDLKILPFRSAAEAKAGFYLKRCQLLTGNETYLRGLAQTVKTSNSRSVVLPEVIAQRPIYAYVDRDNNRLRLISKWILNAPRAAEAEGMTAQNINIFIGNTDSGTRNLLGDTPKLWQAFGLRPDWVKKAIAELGNFGEMYERNLGKDSSLKIDRDQNNLIKNDGLIQALPFL